MKFKYFLRGFGVGVVLTALTFCICYRVYGPSQNVLEQAKKLGMVFPEGTSAPVEPAAAESSGEPSETKKPIKADATAVPEEDGHTGENGTRFTVRGGLLSSSVAREMMQAGIIESDKKLDDYLEKNGYAREVRAGTYWIPDGASYKEIAEIITGHGN